MPPTHSRRAAPLIAGVGQAVNKDPDRLVHPIDLVEEAAHAAFADAGADVRASIGAVHAAPLSVFSEEQGSALLAERLGLPGGGRYQWRFSGAAPQDHLAQACREIAAGRIDAALLVGGVADASVRNARRRGVAPPALPTSIWSQGSDGAGLERPPGEWRHAFSAETGAGAQLPSSYFAVLASALAAAAGHGAEEHRRWFGEVLAPFTRVAAERPDLAWFPQARTPTEIAGPTVENRLVAEPFTKLMCSFPTVDLAAAVLVMSTDLADRTGVPAEQRVHPWAAATSTEHGPPSTWPTMSRSEAYGLAAQTACEAAGVAPDDIEAVDLYSCFPAAIEIGMGAFGIRHGDPRALTLTGGLPYFGGPGPSYALHAIVAAAERCRRSEGLVAVGALGGFVDKFAVGLYRAAPPERPFTWSGDVEPLRPPDRRVPVTRAADAVVEVIAGTILHDRDAGPVEAPIVVELPDGSRLGAPAGDPALPAAMSGSTLVGRTVRVCEDGDGAVWFAD